MALRTLFTMTLLLIFIGMSGFAPHTEATQGGLFASSAMAVGHASCPDHDPAGADESCCILGSCGICSLLPTSPASFGPTTSAVVTLLPGLVPLRSGLSISPAQEPPRQI